VLTVPSATPQPNQQFISIHTSPEMDPAVLEAIKTHLENILQNNMQDAVTSLRQELVTQREAHRNELEIVQRQLTTLQQRSCI